MELYISEEKVDELAGWRPDRTGLVAILAAVKSRVDVSANLAVFSVDMNCGLSEKEIALSTMQHLCNMFPNMVLIPVFESYKRAEKRLDEIYEKNYRHVLSIGAKTIYDISSIILTGTSIKTLDKKDSKKFGLDLAINKKIEKSFRAHLARAKQINDLGDRYGYYGGYVYPRSE
ncbi:MAG: hypothetical protein HY438_02550 [DPANN group archaeon]|nr:hypothetical protein [DPANN group archaeon]